MSSLSKNDQVLRVLREHGGEMRSGEIADAVGVAANRIGTVLQRMLRQGKIRKVRYGVYVAVDSRTLSEVTGIEVRREVRPVNAGAVRPVELRPQNGEDRTIPLLLEVVARAPDPKPYAGIVQEIGRLLSA